MSGYDRAQSCQSGILPISFAEFAFIFLGDRKKSVAHTDFGFLWFS